MYKSTKNKANMEFCRARGIAMSGRAGGKAPAGAEKSRAERRAERRRDIDRNEVERFFSVDKRKFGAGLLMTKLSESTLANVALAVLVANLFETDMGAFFCSIFRRLRTARAPAISSSFWAPRRDPAAAGRRPPPRKIPLWADTNYGFLCEQF